ncbi:type VI secretion system accessory protein TagJ [Vibrio parahaemolyticus]|uniref:type VI secretion system accessory protein TagJ n=1 Tax=Vibrio parahaemolyticus TaxID=670 RepID=UPI0004D7166D|nr:type VI secretion system accessory protein TagJ [Vibrio parahaemolyticus]AVW97280.1 protein of avirulence locus [Vibrio parahaemolyticus]EGQ8739681.1 protein of avirulence locus [Vibrio parahaemolyticus]EGQ8903745.1 protein of avirulence locus [Vibrio parahaemolyticus]EGQ9759014.1 protein of avirulence locus [Vibrio parahaemolyticus]EGR3101111.1 protein of avirulence locus [Vibrio parahaemolyticus]
MTLWKNALSEGQLQQALELLIEAIKASPKDASLRSSFIELLCIDGDFERADEQLMQSIKLFPEYLPGASQLRHLVKAAQARKDFAQGAATAKVLGENEELTKSLVSFNLSMVSQDYEQVSELALQIEELRQEKGFLVNDTSFSDVRDIDDRLGGYIELFSTAGNYFLVPIASINTLEIKSATSLLESVWRPVEFDIDGLGEGEGHMPMTYVDSESDAQKLGRETDWKQIADKEVYLGLGLKCWLVGEMALPISDLQNLQVIKELA